MNRIIMLLSLLSLSGALFADPKKVLKPEEAKKVMEDGFILDEDKKTKWLLAKRRTLFKGKFLPDNSYTAKKLLSQQHVKIVAVPRTYEQDKNIFKYRIDGFDCGDAGIDNCDTVIWFFKEGSNQGIF